jgi:stage V sporulation protein AD
MGGAMAPAEVDTVEADFRDLGGKPSDYDLIAAGDLGNEGHQIAKDLLQKHGIEMGENLGLRYDDL